MTDERKHFVFRSGNLLEAVVVLPSAGEKSVNAEALSTDAHVS